VKKIIIVLYFLFLLSSCSSKKQPTNVNDILLSIKNYSCSMEIESFSNKNTVTYFAEQTYQYPDTYIMKFDDNDKTIISYNTGTLSISSNKLNIFKNIQNYENINQNPLFLAYFLNTYFNTTPENILVSTLDEVSIILPTNNPYLHKATLKLENDTPTSITYFDKNGTPKVNIIYNKFNSESL